MIKVNLLPEENRIREVHHTPILSIGMTIVSLALAVISIHGGIVHIGNKKKIDMAEENLSAIQETLNELTALKGKIAKDLKPQHEALRTILTNEINWAQALNMIAKNVPNNVWLSQLELNDSPEDWSIVLNGFAVPVTKASAIATVGEFSNSLKTDIKDLLLAEGVSSDIELLTTTKQKLADRTEIIEFKASLVRTQPPKTEDKKGDKKKDDKKKGDKKDGNKSGKK